MTNDYDFDSDRGVYETADDIPACVACGNSGVLLCGVCDAPHCDNCTSDGACIGCRFSSSLDGTSSSPEAVQSQEWRSLKSGTPVLHNASLHRNKILDDNSILRMKVRGQLDVFEHDEVMEVMRGSLSSGVATRTLLLVVCGGSNDSVKLRDSGSSTRTWRTRLASTRFASEALLIFDAAAASGSWRLCHAFHGARCIASIGSSMARTSSSDGTGRGFAICRCSDFSCACIDVREQQVGIVSAALTSGHGFATVGIQASIKSASRSRPLSSIAPTSAAAALA